MTGRPAAGPAGWTHLVAGVCVWTASFLLSAPAHAATCEFDPETHVMAVTVAQEDHVRIERGHGAGDPLLLDGSPCGAAAVHTTARIEVRPAYEGMLSATVQFSLRGGPLAPGFGDEPGDSDEIEVGRAKYTTWIKFEVEGSDGPDHIAVGSEGNGDSLNLNADEADGVDGDLANSTFGGPTRVSGGGGADVLDGGGASPFPSPTFGDVAFYGGPGDDQLYAGASGDNVLDGGDGNDLLVSSEASYDNSLDGGAGNDTLTGGDRDDALHGGPGDDSLDAGPGKDVVTAGTGADALWGGLGTDRLSGGPGVDTVVGGSEDAWRPWPYSWGQNMTYERGDVLDFSDSTGSVRVDLFLQTVANDGHGSGDAISGIEGVIGGAGDDVLVGDARPNDLDGRAGDDTASGGGGDDGLVGGGGNDDLAGDGEVDAIWAGPGDDRLSGGEGNDELDGHEGDDHLSGGLGDDLLVGRTGLDTYSGGPNEGVGDTAQFLLGPPTSASIENGIAVERATGGAEPLEDIENLTGSVGADELIGDRAANTLNGSSGSDVLVGVAGTDTLIGGGAGDSGGARWLDTADYSHAPAPVSVDLGAQLTRADGYGSSDALQNIGRVVGSPGADDLSSGRSWDTLDGSGGPDVLRGSEFTDWLHGGAGADVLTGLAGDDMLYGGPGADDLAGGDGIDAARYELVSGAVRASLTARAATDDGDGGADAFSEIETLVGSPNNDVLEGDGEANTLFGMQGNDVLEGRGGDDDLRGAAGTDTLAAGDGADILHGADGYDALDGGAGRDTGDYKADARIGAPATIVDLAAGVASGPFDADTIVAVEDLIGGSGNDEFFGDDGPNNFTAFGGRNVLHGRGGDDVMSGNSGLNTFRPGPGNDIVNGMGSRLHYPGDTVEYSQARGGVVVDLRGSGEATDDGDGGHDLLRGVWNVSGSDHDDVIYGNAVENRFYGGDGDDLLDTGAGPDRIAAGPGRDIVHAGADRDEVGIRDGEPDQADCGDGSDFGEADGAELDDVSANCEDLDRKMPSAPSTGGTKPSPAPRPESEQPSAGPAPELNDTGEEAPGTSPADRPTEENGRGPWVTFPQRSARLVNARVEIAMRCAARTPCRFRPMLARTGRPAMAVAKPGISVAPGATVRVRFRIPRRVRGVIWTRRRVTLFVMAFERDAGDPRSAWSMVRVRSGRRAR